MNDKPTKTTSSTDKPATDWSAFDALADEDIRKAVASDPDAAPILDRDWFEKAELVMPGRKRPISIRLDQRVIDYFMTKGQGYQTRINAVLLNYVKRQQGEELLRALGLRPSEPEARTARAPVPLNPPGAIPKPKPGPKKAERTGKRPR